MWEMGNIHSLAIAQLSSCASPLSKITLGRKYDHPPWIRDGFLQLCLRPEALAMEEAEGLSLKDVVGVAQARERMRSTVIRSSCHQTWGGNGEAYETRYDTEDCYQSERDGGEATHTNAGSLLTALDPQIHEILAEVVDLQEPFATPRHGSPAPLRTATP